jgi:hypothetical protein
MKPIYIVLICAASIFLVLFIIYLIIAIRGSRYARKNMDAIKEHYQGGNLRKMEYDYASYDEFANPAVESEEDGQVTIEEVLDSASSVSSGSKSDEEIFGKVESDGVEEIKGNYKP